MFLIYTADGSGQIVDLYGKNSNTNLRERTAYEVHLNDAQRGVWNLATLESSPEILLLPSLFDVLTVHSTVHS